MFMHVRNKYAKIFYTFCRRAPLGPENVASERAMQTQNTTHVIDVAEQRRKQSEQDKNGQHKIRFHEIEFNMDFFKNILMNLEHFEEFSKF